jgi:ABC-type multidrug transport system ATPase subunit
MSQIKLFVEEGLLKGQEFPVSEYGSIIGRESNEEVNIVVPSPSISRRHACIFRSGDQYLIQDLDSTNGTFLNGRRLDNNPAPLRSGDRITLAKAVTFIFQGPAISAGQQGPRISSSSSRPGDSDVNATLLGDVLQVERSRVPPQFQVAIAGQAPKVYQLTGDLITIGRATNNNIVIPSMIVSRQHARLERMPDGYQITVLPDAGNPVYLEGRPLSGPHLMQHGDLLRIGGQDPGTMVTMTYQFAPEVGIKEQVHSISFGEKNELMIGRDPSNDVILDYPVISRYHAQIERIGQRYRVKDLNSSNGTFVNNDRISEEVWLQDGDSIRVGPYRFVLGQDELAQYDESGGVHIEAVGLNKWVRKDLNILQNISLVFEPREFIVIVGQSGGGKSTLVDAISGYRPATHGRVFVNGVDAYKHFDAIRDNIGYVPQKDIIHMELSVYQAMDYAAKLRMPPDTSAQERHKRIMEVLDDLDLTHRKDVRISGLSGGQQKRVSIGVELLTKPGLFFLDEATTGLDPGTETSLMQIMRRLADQGRTILLVTHATKNVMLADKVVFLARGGYMAWFGPPEGALQYFDQYRTEEERRAGGTLEFDEIYAKLDNPALGSAQEWAERYQKSPAYQRYIYQPLSAALRGQASGAPALSTPARKSRRRRQVSSLRQFFILSARNFRVIIGDRLNLFLLLATAPLVSMMILLLSRVMGSQVFDYLNGDIFMIGRTLFLVTVFGVMIGAIAEMREFSKENEIYKRERMVSLKLFPYVVSKVWVAGIIAFYHAIWYVVIYYIAFDVPGGIIEFLIFYVTMALATLAGMMLGLFASVLAPNSNAVPLLVILLLIPQFVLGGPLLPMPRAVKATTSTSWAFEAIMAATGVGSDVDADPCWDLAEESRAGLSLDEKAEFCRCMGENVMREESCYFPGLGVFYDPVIDEPPPVEPAELGEAPPEPVIPTAPPEPENRSDKIAMAAYFQTLSEYQDEVTAIQNEYKAQVEAHKAEAKIQQAKMISYQEDKFEWEVKRDAVILPAENLIEISMTFYESVYVDKEDEAEYWSRIFTAWIAQLIIITILFVLIIILQKRKDVL